MNKDLPNVNAFAVDKKFANTQEIYYGKPDDMVRFVEEDVPVEQQINRIFNAKDYVYKKDVHLELEERSFDTTIIGKTEKSILTMEGETIPISKIRSIRKR